MNELPFLPIVPRLGAEIQIGTKKYKIISVSRDETDKFKECEIKIERAGRFLRPEAIYAIHKEPNGPVRKWLIN